MEGASEVMTPHSYLRELRQAAPQLRPQDLRPLWHALLGHHFPEAFPERFTTWSDVLECLEQIPPMEYISLGV